MLAVVAGWLHCDVAMHVHVCVPVVLVGMYMFLCTVHVGGGRFSVFGLSSACVLSMYVCLGFVVCVCCCIVRNVCYVFLCGCYVGVMFVIACGCCPGSFGFPGVG